ncbi:3-oxo-5-alpha-steroid 4-dehydrogenase-domain-containing protein [Cerioporus squamosus]|nr:3-oxo-5-alpha-steroid 4-dehydrogenase-domain-containing protein [Cerioporus squamosus]
MPPFLLDVHNAQVAYDTARKWFALIPPFFLPPTFFIDAPFGRFASLQKSIFSVDGIRSWIFMELVSFGTFIYTYTQSPLSPKAAGTAPPLTLTHPPTFLASLFLTHYLNRAIISPLRTPSRSKSHLSVVLSAVVFNTLNGSLMGSYLSSPAAQTHLAGAFQRPLFWFGVALWAVGFAGNIYHDEILLNIRRNAKAKGKDKADDNNGKDKSKGEHYAIPHGALYRFISYPNYFCEWAEWLGFALAAAPAPSFASLATFTATVTPPWIFFLNEVWLMLPRAYKGHKWYHNRFPDYPKERKAVIPFVF